MPGKESIMGKFTGLWEELWKLLEDYSLSSYMSLFSGSEDASEHPARSSGLVSKHLQT